ncbi:MAG: type II secretion system protein [Opitutaceae bacterium]|nr:type II secretion system protein [Opitutaceae bacterium]
MKPRFESKLAFSLIEMIGVMAIMAILASVIVPTTLLTIERAAVRAEKATLRTLGAGVIDFVRFNSRVPTTSTNPPAYPAALPWATDITTPQQFVTESAANLRRNPRNVDRILLVDTSGGNYRALLISGMRSGVALPSLANLNSTAAFDAVWNTADYGVPANGTGIWAAWAALGEYLCIERINLMPHLQDITVVLQNSGASAVSYEVLRPNGTTFTARTTFAAGASPRTLLTKVGQRVNLYSDAVSATPAFSYVVTPGGRTFVFTTSWTPL